jgi:hypothetical protein
LIDSSLRTRCVHRAIDRLLPCTNDFRVPGFRIIEKNLKAPRGPFGVRRLLMTLTQDQAAERPDSILQAALSSNRPNVIGKRVPAAEEVRRDALPSGRQAVPACLGALQPERTSSG